VAQGSDLLVELRRRDLDGSATPVRVGP
jgi:hypothetical protein